MSKKSNVVDIDALAQEVVKGLQEYAASVDQEVEKAVRKTATAVKKEIVEHAPVKTGKYQKSWSTKIEQKNSHTTNMIVYSKKQYRLAHLLEKGYVKRNGKRSKKIPHIRPAEEHGKEMLVKLILKGIKEKRRR